MRHTGTIKQIHREKGFGFIRRPDQSDVFLHKSDLAYSVWTQLAEGLPVSFEIEDRGRGPRAVQVAVGAAPALV